MSKKNRRGGHHGRDDRREDSPEYYCSSDINRIIAETKRLEMELARLESDRLFEEFLQTMRQMRQEKKARSENPEKAETE